MNTVHIRSSVLTALVLGFALVASLAGCGVAPSGLESGQEAANQTVEVLPTPDLNRRLSDDERAAVVSQLEHYVNGKFAEMKSASESERTALHDEIAALRQAITMTLQANTPTQVMSATLPVGSTILASTPLTSTNTVTVTAHTDAETNGAGRDWFGLAANSSEQNCTGWCMKVGAPAPPSSTIGVIVGNIAYFGVDPLTGKMYQPVLVGPKPGGGGGNNGGGGGSSGSTPATPVPPSPTHTPVAEVSMTPTPTSAVSNTPTPTQTPSATASATIRSSDTPTPTRTPTETPTFTPSATDVPSDTPTPTATRTNTPTNTVTDTPTNTATATNTSTQTPTQTSTATRTSTNTATDVPSDTPTPTLTRTATRTRTATPTNTATATATEDVCESAYPPPWCGDDTDTPEPPTSTRTPTRRVPSRTPTATPTATLDCPPTWTPTATPDVPTPTPTSVCVPDGYAAEGGWRPVNNPSDSGYVDQYQPAGSIGVFMGADVATRDKSFVGGACSLYKTKSGLNRFWCAECYAIVVVPQCGETMEEAWLRVLRVVIDEQEQNHPQCRGRYDINNIPTWPGQVELPVPSLPLVLTYNDGCDRLETGPNGKVWIPAGTEINVGSFQRDDNGKWNHACGFHGGAPVSGWAYSAVRCPNAAERQAVPECGAPTTVNREQYLQSQSPVKLGSKPVRASDKAKVTGSKPVRKGGSRPPIVQVAVPTAAPNPTPVPVSTAVPPTAVPPRIVTPQPQRHNGSFTVNDWVVCWDCWIDESFRNKNDWAVSGGYKVHGYNGTGDHLVVSPEEAEHYSWPIGLTPR